MTLNHSAVLGSSSRQPPRRRFKSSVSFHSIAAATGAGGAGHAGHTHVGRGCRGRRADKRHNLINEKKKQADRKRKYDSLGIYLGNTSDELERQRTIFGKSHSLLPPISSATDYTSART